MVRKKAQDLYLEAFFAYDESLLVAVNLRFAQ